MAAREIGDGEEQWKGIVSAKDQNDEDDEDDHSDNEEPDPATPQSNLRSKLGIPIDSLPQRIDMSSSSPPEADSIVLGEQGEAEEDQASWESGSIDSQGNVQCASSSSGSCSPPAKRAKGKAESAGSRFLPSLASGFIRGDSDGSDIEDADVGPTKKNRRGQRARKAIWEKKYGKNANHVKKAREEAAAARGRGRDRGGFVGRGGLGRGGGPAQSRGGAPASRGRGGRVRPPPAPLPTTQDAGWSQRTAKKEKEEKSMYPSWIAKQKLKSQESISAAPQGKKIVFDS